MNASTVPILSHGILLLAVLVLGLLARQASQGTRRAKARHVARFQQVQALRDTQQVWLVDGTPSDVQALQQAIERTTALRTWWLDNQGTLVTDTQLSDAPFCVEAHLATLALQKRHTVHQHQLAQWGWASSYVPVCSPRHPHALLVLASAKDLSATDHAFAVALAEMLCHAWAHAPSKTGSAAINPA